MKKSGLITKSKLITRCKELGVMLLDSGDVLRVDAPAGYVIRDTDGHSKDIYGIGTRWTRPDAYRDIFESLAGGLDECDDPDCDSCIHEPMSFAEIQNTYRGERLA